MKIPPLTRIARPVLLISFVGITILSLAPMTTDNYLVVNIWDKAQHASAYLYLVLLVWASASPHGITLRHAALLMTYGIAIEGIQACLPWRSFSFLDMGANAFGIALGIGLITLAMRIKKTRPPARKS